MPTSLKREKINKNLAMHLENLEKKKPNPKLVKRNKSEINKTKKSK